MSTTVQADARKQGVVLNKPASVKKGRSVKWKLAYRAALIPAIILVLWQTLSTYGVISQQLFSSPLLILKQYISLIADGDLGRHLRISVVRASLGFVIGGGSGLLLGLFVGMSRRVEEYVNPTVQMIRTVPLLAITPLFIMWFGFGELSKVLLISLGAFFPLYVNTFLGVRNVDAKLFEVSRVLQFSRYRQIVKLIIPAALPNILLGVRLSLSISWLVLVVAELVGAESGVGYMIQDARSFMQTDVVFVGITIFAAVGKLSDSLVRLLEHRLLRWQDSFKG
ncbi:binding-protein-dependent transport systems inner membrane component [Paenibacillus curdlanolyticus YK9]|uniref:Binding-protein-dependent transport systems inner membrane component n=1 Tax=Paenibacillus curdlanolyticus YK9 TaxID=717606 RepID=E0IAT9_9BACL|nr:ABC transporter permease [Paenibacillus curdlanolyticus]EFM10493.1 binding-protein-dependent transport systems inner membrane component [Paenibacillus curdlanolyticus YK9]